MILENEFNELSYLRMNPDVRKAVKSGTFPSGYYHYTHYGKNEGRSIHASPDTEQNHSIRDYSALVTSLVASNPDNIELAMAQAVGASTVELFRSQGDLQVQMLRRLGLVDGHSIYDLACGSGRTAQALNRNQWQGKYKGADIIPELVNHARQKLPEFEFIVHRDFSIHSDDDVLDTIYAWSLFTHLQLEEIFLYMEDCYRCLKKGGLLIFSFLELEQPKHLELLKQRAIFFLAGQKPVHLDTFLDRKTISILAVDIGFSINAWVDADDASATASGSFGQSVVSLRK